jgi:hypothetical protein
MVKEDSPMSRPRLSKDPSDPRFRELVRALRQAISGPDPVAPDVHFGDIEDMAHEIGRAVAREVCEQAAAEQAASAERPHPCPECNRECAGAVASRDLVTRDGPIRFPEARHHCPRCRRAFFPQSTAAGADAPPVQPQGHRQPRHRRRHRVV